MAKPISTQALWRHRNFMMLWISQTISFFGDQVTLLALPLTAALALHATSIQMGILNAVQYLPFLLFGLLVGVWVDRLPRRPILIITDLLRAPLLFIIPITAIYHVLSIEYLYVIGFLIGICTTFSLVSQQSFLPSLLKQEHIIEANSKLELSYAASEVVGPGMTGILIQLLTAPVAIFIDAFSFLFSGIMLLFVSVPELPPAKPETRPNMAHELKKGLQTIFHHAVLRSIAACSATMNLFTYIQLAVLILYATRDLHLDATQFGLITTCSGIGGVAGASLISLALKRLGIGYTLIGSAFFVFVGCIFFPLAAGSFFLIVTSLVLARFLNGLGSTVYNINQVSLRQILVSQHLQGRINAIMRTIVWGAIPIGSFVGGVLGDAIGLRMTLIVGAIGSGFSFVWLVFSPVRKIHHHKTEPEAIIS